MSRRAVLTGLAGLPLAVSGGRARAQQVAQTRFLVYYGSKFETVPDAYDVVAIEDHAGAAALVNRRPNTTFLSYISMAEVHIGRPYFKLLESRGIVGDTSPDWPDSRFLDLRSATWSAVVLETLVPRAISRGFKGIFLDTVDSAEAMERRDPARSAGMVKAAAALMREIRKTFPGIRIMVNRGYAALPMAAGSFDMLLGESLHATFGPGQAEFRRQTARDIAWQKAKMLEARGRDPKIELYCLDYWDPQDAAGVAKLYAEARAGGIVPYVGTPDLTRVVPEPQALVESRT